MSKHLDMLILAVFYCYSVEMLLSRLDSRIYSTSLRMHLRVVYIGRLSWSGTSVDQLARLWHGTMTLRSVLVHQY